MERSARNQCDKSSITTSEFKSRGLNQLPRQELQHQQQQQQTSHQHERNVNINANSMRNFNYHLQHATTADYKPHTKPNNFQPTKISSNAVQQPRKVMTIMKTNAPESSSCQQRQQRTQQQYKQELQQKQKPQKQQQQNPNFISLQQQCNVIKLKKLHQPQYCMRHEVRRSRPRATNKLIMQRLLSMFEVMPVTATEKATKITPASARALTSQPAVANRNINTASARAVLQPLQAIRQGQKPSQTARLTAGGLSVDAIATTRTTATAKVYEANKTKHDMHNLTYMQFARHNAYSRPTKKYKPSDRDVIFGNARLLLPHSCGWECSRIDWLLELERQEEARRSRQRQRKQKMIGKPYDDCIQIGYGLEFAEREDEHMLHICCIPFSKNLLKWGGI